MKKFLSFFTSPLEGIRGGLLLAFFVSLSLGAKELNVKEPASLIQLSDVATLYINTQDEAAVNSKSTFRYARMWEVMDGQVTMYDSLQIRGRGNSTWGLAKKPYRLKFNEKVRLLGPDRAKAKNWVLMANHADKTLLRNAVASAIGTALGQPFTPGARFVDVVLNGKYIGSYQITDFVDIRKHRVDITEQDEVLLPDADITGGYLFEADGFAPGEKGSWRSSRGVPLAVKSPDAEVITQEQKDYLHRFVDNFEAKLFSSTYADPLIGYRKLVDSLTLASWFLATEYSANPDGYWSVYLYKEQQDDHLYWGPMWDYDIAFNNCNRKGDVTQKLMVSSGFGGDVVQPWVQRLWSDVWFKRLTARMWREAREAGIVDNTLAVVDSLAQVVNQTQALNFGIYPINQHVYNEITLYNSYQEGIDYMKRFLAAHAAYLDGVYDKEVPADGGTTPPPIPDPTPGPTPDPMPDPTPDPMPDEGEYFIPDQTHYYHIYNVGNNHAADVNEAGVCTYSLSDERHATQTWQLVLTDTLGTFQMLLADSQLAITDPATPNGSNYNTGDQLAVTYLEPGNLRQQWRAVRTTSNWSIVNMQTGNAWNNSGGGSAEGNKIISWTNNEQNASKTTRQWRFELAEEIPGIEPTPDPEPDPTPDPEPDDGKEYADFTQGQPYHIQQKDCGLYLNLVEDEVKGTILGEKPEPFYFVREADTPHTYAIASESGLYVGIHANSWNMSAYAPGKWVVEKVEEGYAIRLADGKTYIGFDSLLPGSAAFRDKNYLTDHGTFLIEEYTLPDVDPDPEIEPDPEPDGIGTISPDYRISYSPSLQRIALLCAEADAGHLSGWLQVCDLSGKVVLQHSDLTPLYIDSLPRGIYLLRWSVNGQEHSCKMMKQ